MIGRTLAAAATAALVLSACRSSCGETTPETTSGHVEKLGPPIPAEPEPEVPDAMRSMRAAEGSLQAGKVDDAIAYGESAAKAAPDNAVIWNVLGRAHAAKFDQTKDAAEAKKARDAFDRAISLNATFWPAYQNLGELAEKTGQLQEAAEAYKKVLAAQPNHPDKAKFEAVIQRAEGGR